MRWRAALASLHRFQAARLRGTTMLNAHDEFLLVKLRKAGHFSRNPGDADELFSDYPGGINHTDIRASARRLHADGLAVRLSDSEKPGKSYLRITDTGMARADIIIERTRTRTLKERIASVPRSDWIALLALLVSVIALFGA